MTTRNALHYDDSYYASHYGRLLSDDNYGRLLGKFYFKQIFSRLCPKAEKILDYGAGHGYLTSAVAADCYDPSLTAYDNLVSSNRVAFCDRRLLPTSNYDVVFSSHALEHSFFPGDELKVIRGCLKESGSLILILPCEKVPGPATKKRDENRHFYAWNFQVITNLLIETGYDVLHQEVFYGPFMLKTLSARLSIDWAIGLAATLGRFKRQYPSMLTFCTKTANEQ